jgi:hypothetical protein
MLTRHWWLGLAAATALAGCGSNSGNTDPFPDVAGVYTLQGGFDGFTAQEASFSGTVTLNQPSREQSTLDGTATVTGTINGQAVSAAGVALQNASVTPSGVVSFDLTPGSGITSWTFSGELAGTIIQGTHTLVRGGTTNTGTFTATETAQARAE